MTESCATCRCGPQSTIRKLLRCICACHGCPPLDTEAIERAVKILGNGDQIKAVPDA